MGSRFTSPAADVRDMPEVLLSGHEPGVRVSQQEETYKLSEDGADIETRAKILGHSVKTASKYGAPGNNEIEKAAALLDNAEAA